MDGIDREFSLLAASAKRTACVQQEEVKRFLDTAPRSSVSSRSSDPSVGEPGAAVGSDSTSAVSLAGQGRELRRGAVLVEHLYKAYTALIAYIEGQIDYYKTLPDPDAKRGAVTEMRQLVVGARGLHQSLSWLDAARLPPLDLGTRYLVDHLTDRLVSAQAEVTVVAAIDRSYGTVTNPLGAVLALDKKNAGERSVASDEEKDTTIVVFVPRREQRSGLLHPLIVHELGHAANEQHRLVDNVMASAGDTLPTLVSELARKRVSERGDPDDEDRVNGEVDEIDRRLQDWVEEAVCDSFATQLLGPTYLYSFMAIVGTSDFDAAGEEHPPTRLRVRLILEQLGSNGWKLEGLVPSVYEWFSAQAGVMVSYEDSAVRFCVETVKGLASAVRDTVAEHIGELSFRAEDFTPVRKELAELLEAGIPPSQTVGRSAIERAAIILGSWLFAIEQMEGDLDALATAPDVPELSRLLPKALQDAAVLGAWGGL